MSISIGLCLNNVLGILGEISWYSVLSSLGNKYAINLSLFGDSRICLIRDFIGKSFLSTSTDLGKLRDQYKSIELDLCYHASGGPMLSPCTVASGVPKLIPKMTALGTSVSEFFVKFRISYQCFCWHGVIQNSRKAAGLIMFSILGPVRSSGQCEYTASRSGDFTCLLCTIRGSFVGNLGNLARAPPMGPQLRRSVLVGHLLCDH